MKITKLFAFLLVLIFAFCAMAACAATPEELVADAEEALTKNGYSADFSMSFTSSDPQMNSVLSSIQTSDFEMKVDGDKQWVGMEMYVMGAAMEMEVTVIGNEVYMLYTVDAYGETETVKQKVTMTEEQKKEFLGEVNSTSDLSTFEFEDMTVEKVDGEYIVTCTGVTTESLEELKEIMEQNLGEGLSMTVEDVKLVHVIEDGKYDKSTLSCNYVITVAEEEYTIGMVIEVDFDFEEKVEISAPADADEYEESTYDDIM